MQHNTSLRRNEQQSGQRDFITSVMLFIDGGIQQSLIISDDLRCKLIE